MERGREPERDGQMAARAPQEEGASQGRQAQDRNAQEEQRGSGGRQEGAKEEGGRGGKGKQGQGGAGRGKQEPATAEWVVGIISAVIVLAALGYLFYQALSGSSLPPLVSTRVERVVPMRQGYLVEFRAVNEGSATAANLHVEGVLMRDTATVERSATTLAFVPAETERRGGLFFTRDPRRYRLELRATGYDRP